jgi:hypothetical protein
MKRLKTLKINLGFAILLLNTFILTACSDGQLTDPNAQLTAIRIAKEATGLTPFPTVDPRTILGFDFYIYGTVFYPLLERGEKIPAQIDNKGATTFYISQCEGIVLQQQKGRAWEDIAFVRRCGANPQKLPLPSGTQQDVTFEFKRAYPVSQKPFPQWVTFGKHRLSLVFSADCAPAINEWSECLNKRYYPSVEFELLRGDERLTPSPNTTPVTK